MVYYSKTHEYIRMENETEGFVGISAFAAKQLGNVVYVDLPEEGDEFSQAEDFGAIESVKAASDLYAPVDMEVTEVNEDQRRPHGKLPHEGYRNRFLTA